MRRLRFPPRGVAGQMAVALVASLILIHGIVFLVFTLSERLRDEVPGQMQRLAAAAWTLDTLKGETRREVLQSFARNDSDLHLTLASEAPDGFDWSGNGLPRPLVDELGSRFGIGMAVSPDEEDGLRIVFKLHDGTYLIAEGPLKPSPPFLVGPAFVTVLFLAVCLLVLGAWAARELIRPLQRLAGAVERFGSDTIEPEDLREEGPHEVRQLAFALNRMQHRINQLMENRVRMLAAIGHDLRTPITRLRLRAEYVEDPGLRGAFIDDLDSMDRLLQGGLTYLREGRSGEMTVTVDLASLLSTVSDQCADLGHDFPLQGGAGRVPVAGRPSELLRLFSNLADNALKHAGGGAIRLAVADDLARVEVVDHGPGIAECDKAAMQEPFVSGDAARNKDCPVGFGLGLSICRAIAKGHNGTFALRDTPGGGLTVRVDLPLKRS
ncbi:ATP-binding protein [Breoghania sp. JC706]|uniref:ATP-binding protein n=1 Tax=Breoghania sp. JC706 TaxID=3117732 RepID=UPI00300B5D2B